MPRIEGVSWSVALRAAGRFGEAKLASQAASALLQAARELGIAGIDGVVVPDPSNPAAMIEVVSLDAAGECSVRHLVREDFYRELDVAGLRRVSLDLEGGLGGDVIISDDAVVDDPVFAALSSACAASIKRIGDGGRTQLAANAAFALRYVADGVILVGEDDVIRVWTPSAARILGLTEQQAVGRLIGEVIDDWPRLRRYVNVVHRDEIGREVRADPIPVQLERGERWLIVHGVQVDGAIVYTVRDASIERHRDQQLLDYVSTASHQLRTPVAAIHGASMTLLRDDIPFSDEQRQTFLEMIADGAERLVQTVDAVLQASQVHGEFVPRPTEPIDVRDLIEHIASGIARDESHQLLVDVDPELRVVVDRRAVDIAISNVLENAFKYSPDGGTVSVVAERRGDVVAIDVSDEGIGIAPEVLPRIFDRFYRADPDMLQGIGGTGLGLYITAETLERSGGRISVASTPGEGTTFTIEVPATGMQRADQVVRFHRDNQDRTGTELRDDEAMVRLLAAIDDFDARVAHDEISHLLARYGRSAVLREALIPLLKVVGGGAVTPRSIAREHFISNIIRGRIWSLTRDWQRPARPQIVLACAPEEQHDLGLLMFGVAVHELGWSVTWLGVRTPVAALAQVVEELDPQCVVVSASDPEAMAGQEAELEALAGRVTTWLGGAAAGVVAEQVTSAKVLADGPTEAALDRWFVEATLDGGAAAG